VGRVVVAVTRTPEPTPTRTFPYGSPDLSAAAFFDADHGWVADGARVARTTDGGRTWADVSLTQGKDMDSMDFASAQDGWAAVAGTLYATHDGGATWGRSAWQPEPDVEPGSGPRQVWTVDFADASTGWVLAGWVDDIGEPHNSLFRTGDGGTTWSRIASPCHSESLTPVALSLYRPEGAWVMCSHGGAGSPYYSKELHKTEDDGATWRMVAQSPEGKYEPGKLPETGHSRHIFFLDDMHGWVTNDYRGVGGLLATTDGGSTWDYVRDKMPEGFPMWSTFFDPQRGVMLFIDRTYPLPDDHMLLGTTDGGATWTQLYPPVPTGR
jgi:photosystem II stability/assembly factor-like uncharacterized protein